MKRITSLFSLSACLCCLTVTAWAQADGEDQSEFPQIQAQPVDQAVAVGSSTVLTVGTTNAESYQWVLNGVPIAGATNSTLQLQNVGVNDAGLYSCEVIKGSEVVPTRTASVNVYTLLGLDFVIYAHPVVSSGGIGGCPGNYAGYVTYTKTISAGWGWAPTAGTTVHTASDGGGRSDTKVQYTGKNLDVGCHLTSVTVPHPPLSSKYRFAIYFPNNVPSTNYPIVLSGFDP